jgi:uncharacterized protein YhaN
VSGLRIEQLRLEPWGCFDDEKLDFGAPGVVDLVFGPNAAGKSTITRGILGLLFGIDERTPDNHTYDYGDLRIGAKLGTDEGPLDLVRRKGRTGTLSDTDGQVMSDDTLATSLGGLGREVFGSLLLVDNAALKQGGAELLEGKGEVAASLFAAAAGIANLHRTIEGLDIAAKNLFNPRGRKDAIHMLLHELKEAERCLREATLRPRKHREMECELQQLVREADEMSTQVQGLVVEKADLDRRRKAAPLIAHHAEVTERLEELAGTPDLPDGARERRNAAEFQHGLAETRLADAREKRAEQTSKIEARAVDSEMLARSQEIRAVVHDAPVVIKGGEDRPRREREALSAEEQVRLAAEAVGVEVQELEHLRRPTAVQDGLDKAVRDHEVLGERLRVAKADDRGAAEGLAAAEEDRAGLPDHVDCAGLDAAVRAARRLGPIEGQAAEARAEVERLRQMSQQGLARMSPSPATLSDLHQIVPPSREAVEAWTARGRELAEDAREVEAARKRLEAGIGELDVRQDELDLGQSVPGPATLAEVRDLRDGSWREIRGSIENGGTPPVQTMDTYEEHADRADAIVDEQVVGGAQLERATRIEIDRRALTREGETLAVRSGENDEARAAEQRAWSELWAVVESGTPAPQQASQWLDDRDAILARAESFSAIEAKVKAFEEQIATHRSVLVERLIPMGVESGDSSLAELLEIAEAKVEASESVQRRREQVEADVSRGNREAKKAGADAKEAEAALADWREEWPAILDAVGLPASTTPETALKISRSVAEGLEQLDRQRELERRIAGIDRDRANFAAKVKRLVSEIASDLGDLEPEAAAAALGRRLIEGEGEAAAQKVLLDQRPDLDAEIVSSEEALAAAEGEIAAVLAAAEAENLSDLPGIEERSFEAGTARRELSGLEERAVDAGERRFDELVTEAADFDPVLAGSRLAEIDRLVTELSAKRDEFTQEVGERSSELKSAETDTDAVTAREDIELIKAELLARGREYAQLKLGVAVVRRAMERYRRKHENPLLERANELFRRITLGDFVDLFVDHDDRDGAILVGRQRDGRPKRVEQMSFGTREQLFLALRIAAIERFVATVGPVPVLFDDAVLESDDDRSEKIFETLGELARSTQVIVFTHRRHQAELGERVLADRLAALELDAPTQPLRAAA